MGPLKLLVPLKSSEVYKVRYMQDNACSVLSLSVLVISKRGTLLKLFSGGWRIEVFDYIQVLLYTFVVFCCRVFHKNPQVLYIVLLLGVPNICLSARGQYISISLRVNCKSTLSRKTLNNFSRLNLFELFCFTADAQVRSLRRRCIHSRSHQANIFTL